MKKISALILVLVLCTTKAFAPLERIKSIDSELCFLHQEDSLETTVWTDAASDPETPINRLEMPPLIHEIFPEHVQIPLGKDHVSARQLLEAWCKNKTQEELDATLFQAWEDAPLQTMRAALSLAMETDDTEFNSALTDAIAMTSVRKKEWVFDELENGLRKKKIEELNVQRKAFEEQYNRQQQEFKTNLLRTLIAPWTLPKAVSSYQEMCKAWDGMNNCEIPLISEQKPSNN